MLMNYIPMNSIIHALTLILSAWEHPVLCENSLCARVKGLGLCGQRSAFEARQSRKKFSNGRFTSYESRIRLAEQHIQPKIIFCRYSMSLTSREIVSGGPLATPRLYMRFCFASLSASSLTEGHGTPLPASTATASCSFQSPVDARLRPSCGTGNKSYYSDPGKGTGRLSWARQQQQDRRKMDPERLTMN